jgi:hypothetical protein
VSGPTRCRPCQGEADHDLVRWGSRAEPGDEAVTLRPTRSDHACPRPATPGPVRRPSSNGASRAPRPARPGLPSRLVRLVRGRPQVDAGAVHQDVRLADCPCRLLAGRSRLRVCGGGWSWSEGGSPFRVAPSNPATARAPRLVPRRPAPPGAKPGRRREMQRRPCHCPSPQLPIYPTPPSPQEIKRESFFSTVLGITSCPRAGGTWADAPLSATAVIWRRRNGLQSRATRRGRTLTLVWPRPTVLLEPLRCNSVKPPWWITAG